MRALEHHLNGGYELGALATSEEGRGLYLGLGWRVWTGPTARLDPTLPLIGDRRDGDVW